MKPTLNQKLALGTDLYYREYNYYSDLYDVRQIGGRVGLTKALGSEFLIGGVSYTLEEIGILDVDDEAPQVIQDEPTYTLISKFGTTLAYDTSNSVELPNRGQRTELLTELAGPFGGEADFYKLELGSFWYFPGALQKHVIEVGGQIGVVEAWGRSDNVPLFDKFFLGGISSLRGYKYHDVGPHVDDEPIGGNTFWFATFEYSLPILPTLDRLRFAVFYDVGNVYVDAYSFDLAENQRFYNDNWGVGIRLNIPRLGPLRLDYGIPITHDKDASGKGRFQFSVGFKRQY